MIIRQFATGQALRRLLYNPRDHWHRQAVSWLPATGPVLDLACGKGAFLDRVAERGIGLDWNRDSLGQAALRGRRVVRGSVLQLPFADRSFAGVHAADIIEHFMPDDAHRLLGEAVRVLRPGGRLVVSTPLDGPGFYNDPTHIRPYPPEALLMYGGRADEKGAGTNPTLGDLPAPVRVVALRYRHGALWGLPRYLQLPAWRTPLNLLRPGALAFLAANALARVGIRHPRPAGYLIVFERL